MNTLQIGAVFPQTEIGRDPSAIRDFAQAAESLGFSHLLIYDHVLGADRNRPGGFDGPYDSGDAFHEPLVTIGFLAAVTETIEFCTTVLVLPQRQTALVAKQVAEVDLLSQGRFRLGIGVGWNRVEYEALGAPFGVRGRLQEEQVEVMRALWRNPVVDFQGEWHRITRAGINPRPLREIPIWFGGSASPLLRRAARMGDGWIPLMGPSDRAEAVIQELRTYLVDEGRDLDSFGIQAQAQARGGNPTLWARHAEAWRKLGATHLAIATTNAGFTSVRDHIDALEHYKAAVVG